MLFKKAVLKLNANDYTSQDVLNMQLSFAGKKYVCKTCHSKVIQGRLPCQALVNNHL